MWPSWIKMNEQTFVTMATQNLKVGVITHVIVSIVNSTVGSLRK